MTATASANTPDTRILITPSGSEYQVPLTATEKELREHLAGTYPDIEKAVLEKSKRKVGDLTYEVWNFVKRAGTKGADGRHLANLLAGTPPLAVSPLPAATAERLRRLLAGDLTVGEALDTDMLTVLRNLPESAIKLSGVTLCQQLDAILPVPASDTCGW